MNLDEIKNVYVHILLLLKCIKLLTLYLRSLII